MNQIKLFFHFICIIPIASYSQFSAHNVDISNCLYKNINNCICYGNYYFGIHAFIVLNKKDTLAFEHCIEVFPIEEGKYFIEILDSSKRSVYESEYNVYNLQKPNATFYSNKFSRFSELYINYSNMLSFLNERIIIKQYTFYCYNDHDEFVKEYINIGEKVEKRHLDDLYEYAKTNFKIKLGIVVLDIDGFEHYFSYIERSYLYSF